MPVELFWADPLLAMAGQDRLQRRIPSFNRLKGSQRGLHSVLGQMV